MIVIFLNVYDDYIPIKGILIFLVIFVYGTLAEKFNPYTQANIKTLDRMTSAVCSLSMILGVFIYKNPFVYFQVLALIIIFVVNLFLIIKMIL